MAEIRTSANGSIAAEAVAHGPADGSVLLQGPMGTISPELPGAMLPVDPRTELVPAADFALSCCGIVTGVRSAHRSLVDVMAVARARSGPVSYASAGVGSAHYLTGVQVAVTAGIDLGHVPYHVAALAAFDLIAGRVGLPITDSIDVVRQVHGGELCLLALPDAQGVPDFADTPCIADTALGLKPDGVTARVGRHRRTWGETVRRANTRAD